ncbi:MAG TPA: nicotinate-nucleotide--dimethylbenzimidazole phosphoribosyltransferase [Hyphomonas sp.]|nr:nicotinate-nucleotide--dimethylbenzimidazole phosphoribosyltransferase [Hyphomonas sp.]MAN90661.1 nicotinate-nucleotide--dimethylbenzimidazole phosphoribosyltransferase [Hyphomonadaceae bacterium]QSR22805.1 nicotinate-nucleotide--dimethylbenzimidazole phosphoribosyltransferase [Hyphomonas sp. KY3]MAA81099.1 nicotinate-nucleotide--dimethylbenzimidazole phosphoribosyltransferase [Hyphomonas sp.]MAL44091.1 nicotinate-nucleotide--dimethylbenzimidazole phosphoribosyltransferase [Hyphomonas sp.]M
MSEPAQQTSPLADARSLIKASVDVDPAPGQKVRAALLEMGREGDFGRLGKAAEWLANWQHRFPPRIENPVLAVFASSHGLQSEGVSLSSQTDTRAHVDALREGKAPLSAIATQAGAAIRVFDLAIDKPTPSIAEEPAMTERECAATIAYGFEATEEKPDLLALAVSGAGVGTAAAAVACALYGGAPDYWVRPDNQSTANLVERRVDVVSRALALHRGHLADPLQALRYLGGRELAACVGAIIAARHQGIPVVLDGFATTIAAAVVHSIEPKAISHCIASHVTRRPAHEAAVERLGLQPLLQLEFQTGGGLGSATAIGLLKTACAPFIAEPSAANAT